MYNVYSRYHFDTKYSQDATNQTLKDAQKLCKRMAENSLQWYVGMSQFIPEAEEAVKGFTVKSFKILGYPIFQMENIISETTHFTCFAVEEEGGKGLFKVLSGLF